MSWELCPVCLGKGIVPPNFYSFHNNSTTLTAIVPERCRTCDGKGVLPGAIQTRLPIEVTYNEEKATFEFESNGVKLYSASAANGIYIGSDCELKDAGDKRLLWGEIYE